VDSGGESRYLSFWKVQIGGWACFYVMVLVASLPFLKQPGVFRDTSLWVAAMFASSWLLLRPVCRSLLRWSLPWLGLGVRAAAYAVLLGGVVSFFPEIVYLNFNFLKIGWTNWLVNFVQSSVVLFLWCNLYFTIKQWQTSKRERDRLLHAEAEAREARLSALRYQLNPHFLFNALNGVSTLVLEGDKQGATRMLAQIGDLLRTTLDGEPQAQVPLLHEVAFVQRYLAIEQTRLGQRLHVRVAIDPETQDALVPTMLLQPLVENAVRHGIAATAEDGTIVIESRRIEAQLKIMVKNSGTCLRGDEGMQQAGAGGIGVSNTLERLKTLYGDSYIFELQWPAKGGCEVLVIIPFHAPVQEGQAACER
jgi:two-component system, LytTR family, sensor kinase